MSPHAKFFHETHPKVTSRPDDGPHSPSYHTNRPNCRVLPIFPSRSPSLKNSMDTPRTQDRVTQLPSHCNTATHDTPLASAISSQRSIKKKKTVTIVEDTPKPLNNTCPLTHLPSSPKRSTIHPHTHLLPPPNTLEYFIQDKISSQDPSLLSVLEEMRTNPLEEELLSHFHESHTKTYKDVSNKNGVRIRKKRDGSIYVGTVTFSPEESSTLPMDFVMRLLWLLPPSDYNSMLDFVTRIYTLPSTATGAVSQENGDGDKGRDVIFYQAFQGSFGFPGRDFLLYGRLKKMEKNLQVFASKSVKLPCVDNESYVKGNKVRGVCKIGGYICQVVDDPSIPAGSEFVPKVLSITAIWVIDLMCSLPSFILSQIQSQSLTHLSALKEVILKRVATCAPFPALPLASPLSSLLCTPVKKTPSQSPKTIMRERSSSSRACIRRSSTFFKKKKKFFRF